jgi:hypothetical protein
LMPQPATESESATPRSNARKLRNETVMTHPFREANRASPEEVYP